MKISALNNTNFEHRVVKPGKMANFMYSALLSASMLGMTVDTFKKSDDCQEPKTENVIPVQKAHFYDDLAKNINEESGRDSDSSFGKILTCVLFLGLAGAIIVIIY